MTPSNFLFIILTIHSFSISLPTTTFTLINKCHFTVWPAVLSNAGHPPLPTTGFELPTATSHSIQSPPGWSGRFWGRTGCLFDSSNKGSCTTGDCGSGKLECAGKSESPPATLAEFSLAGGEGNKLDFYDVSLVDGYNLAMLVEGGKGRCAPAGCAVDLNQRCPAELRVGEGETTACRSACEAFRRPEYCCSGEFASPSVCRPTAYSQLFKGACPKAYSYAFDDSSSTFTCADAGEFTVTFCPDGTPSQKSSKSPQNNPTATTGRGVPLDNNSWLASLASGSSSSQKMGMNSPLLIFVLSCSLSLLLMFFS
ncbi:thaumatin-like protein 1b [Phalaenopsis equestris]|uniref:thaumatin-like protein 1b n=1 Tax=Phalaenopsis equestris TaxID=78828 RepID=UPI0009E53731|nr:thaumatin-like protein 1b [Phalaenopsis equestris]